MLGVFRPVEQPIDQLLPFVLAGVGEKLTHLVRSGKRPDNIDVDAPDELGIVNGPRRRNAKRL